MFVTNSEAQQCIDGDGCVLVTREQIAKAMRTAFEKGEQYGAKEAKGDCWANTTDKLR